MWSISSMDMLKGHCGFKICYISNSTYVFEPKALLFCLHTKTNTKGEKNEHLKWEVTSVRKHSVDYVEGLGVFLWTAS